MGMPSCMASSFSHGLAFISSKPERTTTLTDSPPRRIDVRQQSRDPRASGTFRMTDGTTTLEAVAWGVLQTTDKWASFTARVSTRPAREERSAIVILESGDPFLAGQPRTVTIVVDGQRLATGVLQ